MAFKRDRKSFSGNTQSIPVADALRAFYGENISAKGKKGQAVGVMTGLSNLDAFSVNPGNSGLIVIAAGPSTYKTALALEIAKNAADKDCSVGFVSLEMSGDRIAGRLLASNASVPLWRLYTGRLSPKDVASVRRSIKELSQKPIYLIDRPSLDMSQLRSIAKDLKSKQKIDFLVIDSLQLIRPRVECDDVTQCVEEVSKELRLFSCDLGVPILVTLPLSIGEKKIPQLSDVRKTGFLEREADIILLLHREDGISGNAEKEQNRITVAVAKNRRGPVGTTTIGVDSDTLRFSDVKKTKRGKTISPQNH